MPSFRLTEKAVGQVGNYLKMAETSRKVVLGLGNLLYSDEGFGIHALSCLVDELGSHFDVEWVDGGVLGLNLLPLVEACSHLLVLDAVDAGLPGGMLVEMDRDEIPLYNEVKMSEHQVGFQEVLALARLRGHYPEFLHLIGVQPVNLSTGAGLSADVAAALPEVLRHTENTLNFWFEGK